MNRRVFCQKLKLEAEGLEKSPYPGAIGERIFENISKQAWQMWLGKQTMFINEYRLNMVDAKARQFLLQEMDKFLFSENDEHPPGYIPPSDKTT